MSCPAIVPGRRVDGYPEATQPGDFFWSGKETADVLRLSFLCPCGCGALLGARVPVGGGEQDSAKGTWSWNGDREKPTLQPSIRFLGGCQWHGYLTAGEFVSC